MHRLRDTLTALTLILLVTISLFGVVQSVRQGIGASSHPGDDLQALAERDLSREPPSVQDSFLRRWDDELTLGNDWRGAVGTVVPRRTSAVGRKPGVARTSVDQAKG